MAELPLGCGAPRANFRLRSSTSAKPVLADAIDVLDCRSESANSVAAQEAVSANADYVVRLPAAHMVQLSRPDELAEALGRI